MQVGVVFPQVEVGERVADVRRYVETVAALGYQHVLAYDHVLGADISRRPDWRGPYTSESTFHEVLVLFGYIAALAPELELVTGILISPQRQTALIAKQAAEVDILSNGKLRLGVGIGWNEVEYIGLNEDFHTRGRRIEEQIKLLRRLWTQTVVDFDGKFHQIPGAGIKPLPVQQLIPIWIGGYADVVLERVGRLADGWFPGTQPGPQLDRSLAIIHESAAQAGRKPEEIGIEGRITLQAGNEDDWQRSYEAWQATGAGYLSVNTMGQGRSLEEHLRALERFAQLIRR